jgi:hypothetical protein
VGSVLTRRSSLQLTGLAGLLLAALLGLVAAVPASAAELSSRPAGTPTFNGPVYAVAWRGDTVYVGGTFTAALVNGKQVVRQRLAAIDVRTGALLDWAPAADRAVRAIAVTSDGVYLGGDFQSINGFTRDSVAKVHPVSGAPMAFKHRINGGTPRALAVGHGRLYIAGLFTGVDGIARGNVAAFSLATGALDDWAPRTDDLVETIAVAEDRVYLGGSFHRTNDVSSTGRLIAVRPDTAAVDMGFRPYPSAIVHSVTVAPTGVYAAIGGQGGRTIAYAFDATPQWTVTTDGDVQAVTRLGDTVYLGGHFDNVCRTARTGDHGVCLDGSVPRVKFAAVGPDGALLPWAPNGNGVRGVLALAASPALGAVAAGGEFTTVGGVTHKRFALFAD